MEAHSISNESRRQTTVLCITRKHPPAIGGMENYSYQLLSEWRQQEHLEIISWGGSQIWLLAFMSWAFVRSVILLAHGHIRYIHIGDPLLSVLGLILKWWAKIPIFVTAHGLDVTYENFIYQMMLRFCLPRFDGVICISEHTRSICLSRGVAPERCRTIFPGTVLGPDPLPMAIARQKLTQLIGVDLTHQPVMLSVGRLIERKGFVWFVQTVMPRLVAIYPQSIYLICGNGPLYTNLANIIRELSLSHNVLLLGKVEKDVLDLLYAAADIFIMPNIPIPNEPEGFGLVTLEARAAGLPVVASDLEGVRESIHSGVDGLLVTPKDSEHFLNSILQLIQYPTSVFTRAQIRERIQAIASWPVIVAQYRTTFESWAVAHVSHHVSGDYGL